MEIDLFIITCNREYKKILLYFFDYLVKYILVITSIYYQVIIFTLVEE